jgi:hypothetical protein
MACGFWHYRRQELAGGGRGIASLQPKNRPSPGYLPAILFPGQNGSGSNGLKSMVAEGSVPGGLDLSGYYCRKFHRRHHQYALHHNGMETKVQCACCGRKWLRIREIRQHGCFLFSS